MELVRNLLSKCGQTWYLPSSVSCRHRVGRSGADGRWPSKVALAMCRPSYAGRPQCHTVTPLGVRIKSH